MQDIRRYAEINEKEETICLRTKGHWITKKKNMYITNVEKSEDRQKLTKKRKQRYWLITEIVEIKS